MQEEVLKSFRQKKVLVTGGTGLIGRQVVELLAGAGAELKIVSLDKLRLSLEAEHIIGDLTDLNFCKKVCSGVDFVFHLAGIGASVKAAREKVASHFTAMLMMNTNMLEACRMSRVKKVVYTSSVGAYAPAEIFRESEYRIDSAPMDFAGWAKRMAEAQIEAYRIEYGLTGYSVVRPSNVYGPGDNFHPENSLVIPSLLYRLYHGENPLKVWGDGTAVRDFVFSRDAAEGIVQALHYGTGGKFVNLGSGRPVTIKELLETLRSFIDFEYVFDAGKPSGAPKRVMDITKARETIHYDPRTSLAEGLRQTWEWFRQNPEQHNLKMNYFVRK